MPREQATLAFYQQLNRHSGIALIEGEQQVTYQELEQRVQACSERLAHTCQHTSQLEAPSAGKADEGMQTALVALPFSNTLACAVMYLACLRTQVPVLVVDPDLEEAVKLRMYKQLGVGFEARFSAQSDARIDEQESQLHALSREQQKQSIQSWSQELALMLSTSGSSGSPKAVMLSQTNLQANTESICTYLPMQSTDVGITSLPLHYTYGLSVLHTHLAVGARLVLTQESLMSKGFWNAMKEHQVTSFSGVPFHYQMLQRLRFERMELPALRYMTQAGGKLAPALVTHFAQLCQERQQQFFVMYGQTEATARMAYVPPESVLEHPDVIGRAIPGGYFEIQDLDNHTLITEPEQEGELYYRGDNVMLGYAQSEQDWRQATAHTPSPTNPLPTRATGDLACWTAEGFVRITGRLSRFIKVHGKRIQLDHLEQRLAQELEHELEQELGQEQLLYCCGDDDALLVIRDQSQTVTSLADLARIASQIEQVLEQILTESLGLHPSLWSYHEIEQIPRLSNGKIDYTSLLAQIKHLDEIKKGGASS